MTTNINALLIFCEGPHDSAFVRKVFKKLMGYSVEKIKFSGMPSPFHHLFKSAVLKHAAQDMSLDMSHKFFLPDTVLRNGDRFTFIFNCGGKDQCEKIKDLLSDYLPLFEQAGTFSQGAQEVTKSIKYLFLYDADDKGIDTTIDMLKCKLQNINDKEFIGDSWEESKSIFGRIANDKAIYILAGSPEKGTLEDILFPMFCLTDENKENVGKAETAMKDMFSWESDPSDEAKYRKAVLTTAGQRKKPGGSLNVIFEQSGLITPAALKACGKTTEFVEFVSEFLGNDQ